MGARLVGLVLAYWTDLPDRQFRVLLRMAHTALDKRTEDKPAETYWGGHDLLAMTLRGPYPDGDDAKARKARAIVLRDVRRDVAALRKAGACQVIDTGQAVRQGHSQTYLLTLDQPNRAGDHIPSSAGPEPPDRAGDHIPSSAGDHVPSSAGDLNAIEQGHSDPPRRKQEPMEELSHLDTDGPVADGSVEDRAPARDGQDQGFSGGDRNDRPGASAEGGDSSTGHGLCSGCHRAIAVSRKGLIVHHGKPRCPGTGQPPASLVTLDPGRARAMVTGWLDGQPEPLRASVTALCDVVARLLAEGNDATGIRRALDAWRDGDGKDAGKLRRYVEAPP